MLFDNAEGVALVSRPAPAQMSTDKAVVTLLYRCMLRWSKQLAAVPLELRAGHVDEVLPGYRQQHSWTMGNIRNLAAWGFRREITGIDPSTVRAAASATNTAGVSFDNCWLCAAGQQYLQG